MAIDWDSMLIDEHAEELKRGLASRDRKIALLLSPTTDEPEPPRGRGRPTTKTQPTAPGGSLDNARLTE